MNVSDIPKIVILGAGYGGVVTAVTLQKKIKLGEAKITIVNKHDYHYLTTHLHMPAAGTDSINSNRFDICDIINKKVDLIKGTITKIDLTDKKVILENETVNYDYLIIALGSEPETFDIPGLKEHAFTIRSINSVRLIKEHIEYQFAKYKKTSKHCNFIRIVVGGAGFTGIEFLGELSERIPKLCQEFDIEPNKAEIINIVGGSTPLAGFDPELVKEVQQGLEEKGVKFISGVHVKECNENQVILDNGELIETSSFVWTGGVRGNKLIEESGLQTKRGRVSVNDYLLAPNYDNVFVIGDGAVIFNNEGVAYPPTAQIAAQQGENCAKNLVAIIRKKELIKFQPNIAGTIVSFGKYNAVGIIGKNRKKFKGLTASMLKRASDLRYIYKIGGVKMVFKKLF